MQTVMIDGNKFEIVRSELVRGWYNLYVKPAGSPFGPHACHSVPQLTGSFFTGGHQYKF